MAHVAASGLVLGHGEDISTSEVTVWVLAFRIISIFQYRKLSPAEASTVRLYMLA